MRKLPVFKSVSEVFSGVTRHYFQLIAASWPSLVFVVAAAGLCFWSLDQAGISVTFEMVREGRPVRETFAAYEAATSELGPLYYVGSLILSLAGAVAAVRWHRFVLLGSGGAGLLRTEDGRYIWTLIKIVLVFLLFAVILMITVAVVGALFVAFADLDDGAGQAENGASLPIAMITVIVGAVVYLISFAVLMRLMLALPDAAIGQTGRVFSIFKATRGNTWRMLGCSLLVGIPAFLGTAVVIGVFVAVPSPFGALLAAVIGTAAYIYFLMTQVTMLSVAYREIVGLPTDASAAVAGETAPA